ncbi:hypothetical protein [Halospeciosus flavus]|uniref:Halobacterial output domain-containing protein n=1 Tax=Halospeciosus flavus TaxID=3032283 RepID=A0ABD5Z6M9_9EURY|nr:hypothetical protein [Halospeciosus flavus]
MDTPEECERAVDRIRDGFDEDLRAVVVHQFAPEAAWEVRYVREDVSEGYGDTDLARVLENVTEDFVFEALVQDWHENIRRLGELHGSLLAYEDAVVARIVLSDGYGVCFSLEPERRGDVFDVVSNVGPGSSGGPS